MNQNEEFYGLDVHNINNNVLTILQDMTCVLVAMQNLFWTGS